MFLGNASTLEKTRITAVGVFGNLLRIRSKMMAIHVDDGIFCLIVRTGNDFYKWVFVVIATHITSNRIRISTKSLLNWYGIFIFLNTIKAKHFHNITWQFMKRNAKNQETCIEIVYFE